MLLALTLTGSAPAGASTTSRLEQSFVEAINKVRADYGRAPVRVNRQLRTAARAHTRDMLERQYFAHTDFARRIVEAGAPGSRVGEDLGWVEAGQMPVETILYLWMQSPPHRAVVLRPGFELVGIGVARGPFRGYQSTVVVTADFAGE
jgi:uncharacterized protein YkwD